MSNALPLKFPDVVGDTDLDLFGNDITSDLQGLEQDVFHMLEETVGSNIDAPTRGAGVGKLLSGPDTNVIASGQSIDSALEDDDRIDSATTVITRLAEGSYAIAIDIGVAGAVISLQYAYTTSGGLKAA